MNDLILINVHVLVWMHQAQSSQSGRYIVFQLILQVSESTYRLFIGSRRNVNSGMNLLSSTNIRKSSLLNQ